LEYPPLIEEHAESRARLQALVDRLTDEQLTHPLGDGWTAAALLAHIAFWERAAVLVYRQQQLGNAAYPILDEDVTNNALLPEWLALPPRVAVRLVLDAVEDVDRIVAEQGDAVISPHEDEDQFVGMARAGHRIYHIREIERAFPA
jgi:hypothetical protein